MITEKSEQREFLIDFCGSIMSLISRTTNNDNIEANEDHLKVENIRNYFFNINYETLTDEIYSKTKDELREYVKQYKVPK